LYIRKQKTTKNKFFLKKIKKRRISAPHPTTIFWHFCDAIVYTKYQFAKPDTTRCHPERSRKPGTASQGRGVDPGLANNNRHWLFVDLTRSG